MIKYFKMNFYKKKKGISGIVAAVMLVSITVIIGSLISSWFFSSIQSSTDSSDQIFFDEIQCGSYANVNFWIREGVTQACINDTQYILKLYLENGAHELSGLYTRVLFTDLTQEFYTLNEEIDGLDIYLLELNYSEHSGKVIDSVTVFPIIQKRDDSENTAICSDKGISLTGSDLISCQRVLS
jgi:flagellin-like protein